MHPERKIIGFGFTMSHKKPVAPLGLVYAICMYDRAEFCCAINARVVIRQSRFHAPT
jgi:hypothetical protein